MTPDTEMASRRTPPKKNSFLDGIITRICGNPVYAFRFSLTDELSAFHGRLGQRSQEPVGIVKAARLSTSLIIAATSSRQVRSQSLKKRLAAWLFPRMPITQFLFDQLRTEINCGKVGLENAVLPSRRRILKQIRQMRDIRANIACGPHPLPNFINLDLHVTVPGVIAWDCRWDLPFADNSVAGLRVEHYLEHLEPREELPAFLKGCLRVLRGGGVLRIIVPDAERYLWAYCRSDLLGFHDLAVPVPFPSDLPTRMDVVNHVFHQWHEHRWGYDCEALSHRLSAAGFGCIERTSYQYSLDPLLAQDCKNHSPYSLYVDAVKS